MIVSHYSIHTRRPNVVNIAKMYNSRPLPAARQRHVGLPLPQLKFATFNVRSLRNKVDATSDLFRRNGFGCRPTSAPSSRLTPSTPHWRLTCLTARDWLLTAAETMRQSSTVWLTRALVMSLSCYGALEIVGLLLLLLVCYLLISIIFKLHV